MRTNAQTSETPAQVRAHVEALLSVVQARLNGDPTEADQWQLIVDQLGLAKREAARFLRELRRGAR